MFLYENIGKSAAKTEILGQKQKGNYRNREFVTETESLRRKLKVYDRNTKSVTELESQLQKQKVLAHFCQKFFSVQQLFMKLTE